MTIPKEVLTDLKVKYEQTEKLVNEESKLDPPTEPFKSHYSARTILLDLANNVKNSMQTLDQTNEADADDLRIYTFILGHITIDLGKIYSFTEELSTAGKYLQQGIDLLTPHNLHPSAICALLNGLNEIGILWMNRNETEKAKEFLTSAEDTYNEFKALKLVPLSIHDILSGGDAAIDIEKGERSLEKINIMTLFYLAQLYGSLGNLEKSAVYCHTTLKKQLLWQEFESVEWALNAATLSQYFCTNNRYSEARHHLAAATQILVEYEKDMIKVGMTDDEKKEIEDNFNHRFADVNRCWVKYGLNLMSDSRDRLLQDSEVSSLNELKIATPLTFGPHIESAYENVITDRYLLDMDDAKPVFLTIQRWIEKAKTYYTAESEATEYSKIVQDNATAYKHLAFFECDLTNQAKMHKRRVDLLEDLLKLLNKTFYLNIWREVLYELGTAYSNILDIKLELMEQNQSAQNSTVNPHALKKINDLITKSRNNFGEFIATYFQAKTETLRTDLSDDELIPIAFAYFQIARICYKYITPDKHQQVVNASNCLENYQRFIALCDAHKVVGEKMKAEVGVSKEMALLLPLKIQRMKDSAGNVPSSMAAAITEA